jgi:hypothetical protein
MVLAVVRLVVAADDVVRLPARVIDGDRDRVDGGDVRKVREQLELLAQVRENLVLIRAMLLGIEVHRSSFLFVVYVSGEKVSSRPRDPSALVINDSAFGVRHGGFPTGPAPYESVKPCAPADCFDRAVTAISRGQSLRSVRPLVSQRDSLGRCAP